MAIIKQSTLVDFTNEQMYNLVNDIKSYPDFLPWCSASEILHQDEDEIRASLMISGAGFEKSFTTCNRLQKNKMIEIRLLDGPFKHLEGFWRFEEEAGQCRVSLDLDFEFAGGWLNFAFEPIFHQIANTLVGAFCRQAEDVYGKAENSEKITSTEKTGETGEVISD